MRSQDGRAMGISPVVHSWSPRWLLGMFITAGETAAAAAAAAVQQQQQQAKTWLEEIHVVAAAVAGPIVAMAAATADCLEENICGQCDVGPDAKAETSSDVDVEGECVPIVE